MHCVQLLLEGDADLEAKDVSVAIGIRKTTGMSSCVKERGAHGSVANYYFEVC